MTDSRLQTRALSDALDLAGTLLCEKGTRLKKSVQRERLASSPPYENESLLVSSFGDQSPRAAENYLEHSFQGRPDKD